MYDFRCPEGHGIFEGLAPMDNEGIPCPECGANSKRLISAVRVKLDGTDPSFPGEYMKWARKHEREGRKQSKDD
jgi:putative FmdB family regulatory protein